MVKAYLLDTCTFLWLTLEPDKLSPRALEVCKNRDNKLFLSAVSAWEIEFKYRRKKLTLAFDPREFVVIYRTQHLIQALPFFERDVFKHAELPFHHRDPFDRMLICQALASDLTILTPDEEITAYDVNTDW